MGTHFSKRDTRPTYNVFLVFDVKNKVRLPFKYCKILIPHATLLSRDVSFIKRYFFEYWSRNTERPHKNTVYNIPICISPKKRDKDWQVYIDHRDISIRGSRMPGRIALNRFSGAEIWNSRDSWNQWKRLYKVIFQTVFSLWKIIFLNLLLPRERIIVQEKFYRTA